MMANKPSPEDTASERDRPQSLEQSGDPDPALTQSGEHKVVIVIPAYNEERFIGSVVLKTRKYCDSVIVVDDGSSDATASIAALAGAQVVCHESNRGKGAALSTALSAARLHHPDVVVMLDADGQHSPDEISAIAAPILLDQADIVIGSRYLGDSTATPRHRVWGHRAFNLMTRLASGVSTSDSQSGYRAFSPQALDVITLYSKGFSVESEMQFIINQHGLRLVEVPITVQYTDKPKRNVFSHGVLVLNGLLRLIGQYRPLLFFGVLGGIVLLAGLAWGWYVVDIYSRVQKLAAGYAMISIMLTIIGSLLLATGFILHSMRGLLMDFTDRNRSK